MALGLVEFRGFRGLGVRFSEPSLSYHHRDLY